MRFLKSADSFVPQFLLVFSVLLSLQVLSVLLLLLVFVGCLLSLN
jgi:hypothetical protein